MGKKRFFICSGLLIIFIAAFGSPAWCDEAPYNAIHCFQGAPLIDGVISQGEWHLASIVPLSRAFHEQHGIRLYFAWDQNFLYLGAYVEDGNLWADGEGNGAGWYGDNFHDDSIEWYFDTNNSQDTYLQESDRLLGLNIGNLSDPENGTGIVSRRIMNKGLGDGKYYIIGLGGQLPDKLTYAVHHYGTVNNSADTDTGYSMEVAVPWDAILMSAPKDGDKIGINAIIISDDTGGQRDWTDNQDIQPPELQFTVPILKDEYVQLQCSKNSRAQSGLEGPVNYAALYFHEYPDTKSPAKVESFSADRIRPYSVRLNWKSPGDNSNNGVTDRFDIRYSTSPITESSFSSARQWQFRTNTPQPAGSKLKTRVMGLTPNTDYYFAIRAVDESNNAGSISTLGPIKTITLQNAKVSISPSVYKGAVQTAAGGRYFMTEDGANFIPVGHHFVMSDKSIRYLYNANVWTGVNQWTSTGFYNYGAETNSNTKVTAYLDELKNHGVTVMRLFLEELSWAPKNNGQFNAANGAYWCEFPRKTYNSAMGQFLKDLMRLCSERGIFLSITPFDTFYYSSNFGQTPWAAANGGPLQNINDFYHSAEALQMCKDRWTWVINLIKDSGYADMIFGYEVLNEWDSSWTQANSDTSTDETIRIEFIKQLADHVRNLDPDHMVLTSTTNLHPRGPLGVFLYYEDYFDALLPHLYMPATRNPWDNPSYFIDSAVVQQHMEEMGWWTLNQIKTKPVLNGEWGPDPSYLPNPSLNHYQAGVFTEADDDLITRRLWFTELCSGAAGPGIRMNGAFRAGDQYGMHLSNTMHGVEKTLSSFVENGVKNPVFSFADFNSKNLAGQIKLTGTNASVVTTGCSDGFKGMAYLVQDRNKSNTSITGSTLNISGLWIPACTVAAEFWQTLPNQTNPAYVVKGFATDGTAQIPVPAFTEDWAVRFYILSYATKDRLAADFGAYGTYVYDGTNWIWISGNPENMAGFGSYFAADFGVYGLYIFDGYNWNWIAGNPENIEGWGERLAADFGSYGLYLFENGQWKYIGGNPQKMDGKGSRLAVDFGAGYGIYLYDGNQWTGIAAESPQDLESWAGALVIDYGAKGLFRYDGTWSMIAAESPEAMESFGDYLALDYGAKGLFLYNGAWTWISDNPENITSWGSRLAADFGAYGVYLYDRGTWTWIAGNPESMSRCRFE